MSAEILRLAAALMRERAETARAGVWYADGADVFARWHDPRFVAACDGSVPEGIAANAVHIASWHPAVALAVADLLDDLSRHKALAVARAYLGGER